MNLVHSLLCHCGALLRVMALDLFTYVINGLSESLRDDRKLLQQTSAICDGLFTLFGKQAKPVRSRKKDFTQNIAAANE
jgi:hypothetical protein